MQTSNQKSTTVNTGGVSPVLHQRFVRTILIEIDFSTYANSPWWKPGYFKAPFKTGYLRRAWWLCFAVAWVNMSLYDYNRYIESGATEWREH